MKKFIWLVAILVLHCGSTMAALTLSGTRIVYRAQSRFADITVENSGADAAQMLAWVDDGDTRSTPETSSAPFFLMPAVAIVRPGRRQLLRIAYNGDPLPQDREAVYYLNILEIPPKTPGAVAAPELKFAVRTRIKIFMRPMNLVEEPLAAAKKMVWERVVQPSGSVLRVRNIGPYFVSLVGVKLMKRDIEVADLGSEMISPKGELEFRPNPGTTDLESATTLKCVYVNDYGGTENLYFDLLAR